MTIDELNALPDLRAQDVLRACCGSSRWVAAMLAQRPFDSLEQMLDASDKAWSKTGEEDWIEAFAHHPRIGDRRVSGWAGAEQSMALSAAATVQEKLADSNRKYEDRFGRIYIVCATGMTAEEMLNDVSARMQNDDATELRISAGEQNKITRIRIRKLLGETS